VELKAWPVRARFGFGAGRGLLAWARPGAPGTFVSRVPLLRGSMGCVSASSVLTPLPCLTYWFHRVPGAQKRKKTATRESKRLESTMQRRKYAPLPTLHTQHTQHILHSLQYYLRSLGLCLGVHGCPCRGRRTHV
jgi:hypothetical protein